MSSMTVAIGMKMERMKAMAGTMLLALGVLPSLALGGQATADQGVVGPETVAYKALPSGQELVLRVFVPTGPPQLAVLLFHGGGWRTGSAAVVDGPCRRLAAAGILAASAQYRLLGQGAATPFDCVGDAAAATACFVALAAERAGRDIPVALGGGSAGGHLALCSALGLGQAAADAPPPRLAALLLYNPVVNLGPEGWRTGHTDLGDRWRELSPVDHLRPGLPPILICHGTADQTVPFANVERFRHQAEALGIPCQLEPFPGKPHGIWNPAQGGQTFEKCHAATLAFLRRQNLLGSGGASQGAAMPPAPPARKIRITADDQNRVPTFLPATEATAEGVHAIYYDGPQFRGKPTRVFAYYGIPPTTAGERVPGMVLVHGGQGTASAGWVRLWNARGYAAIAMDHGGCLPIRGTSSSGWTRIQDGGGPDACSASFAQINDPIEDQWPHYAVNAITLARNLIASFPEVDGARIGITGISWGGVLTCLIAGLDPRYRFAIPVYGCGNLRGNSAFSEALSRPEMSAWAPRFDPLEYVADARMPFLWVTGTNDRFFPPDSLQKTYALLPGSLTLCVKPGLGHSQQIGQEQEEIFSFADSLCRDTPPLPGITGQGFGADRMAWVSWAPAADVAAVDLLLTSAAGAWQDRTWERMPATVTPAAHRAHAAVPPGTTAFFFNVHDGRGHVVSSRHVEIDQPEDGA